MLPKKSRNVTFPETQPISSITSSTRLGAIVSSILAGTKELSQDQYPPWQPWSVSHNDSDNPFNEGKSLEEIVSTVRRPRGPPTPPSDSSDSEKDTLDRNGEPSKLPPQSSKRPTAILMMPKEDLVPKRYHLT
jgi:hypothetical protein